MFLTGTRTLFAGSSCNDVVAGHGMGTTVISGHFDRRIRFWDTRTATANEIALQGKVTSLDHFPGIVPFSRSRVLRCHPVKYKTLNDWSELYRLPEHFH